MDNQRVGGRSPLDCEDPADRSFVECVAPEPVDGFCRERHELPFEESTRNLADQTSVDVVHRDRNEFGFQLIGHGSGLELRPGEVPGFSVRVRLPQITRGSTRSPASPAVETLVREPPREGYVYWIVVLPERPSPEQQLSFSRRAAVITASVLVVLALVALTALTSSDTVESAESTTTVPEDEESSPPAAPFDPATWTVSQIAQGPQLEWTASAELPTYPTALIEKSGTLYLFGIERPAQTDLTRAISLWTSSDGLTWEANGDIGLTGAAQIVASDTGFLASALNTEGGGVFQSTDGVVWDPIDVPDETKAYYIAYAGEAGLVLTENSSWPYARQAIEQALPEEWRHGEYGWGIEGGAQADARLVLYGPLGISAEKVSAEELGISRDDLDRYLYGDGRDPLATEIWINSGEEWVSGKLDSNWIKAIYPIPGGGWAAAGDGNVSPRVWTSPNGATWKMEGVVSDIYNLIGGGANWRNGVVSMRGTAPYQGMFYSTDLYEWEELPMPDTLPRPLSWGNTGVVAGAGGIAYIANGHHYGHREGLELEVVSMEDVESGYTISLDPERGALVISSSEDLIANYLIWGAESPETVNVDLENETVTFSDPDTMEPLVTATFSKLEALEEQLYNVEVDQERRLHALFYSPQGTEWTVQDLNQEFGDNSWPDRLVVMEDRIVVAVTHGFARLPSDADQLSTRIWVGTLP